MRGIGERDASYTELRPRDLVSHGLRTHGQPQEKH